MRIVKSISALVVLFALMFSSMGITVSRHYCMGNLVEERFYSITDQSAPYNDNCNDDAEDFSLGCCKDEHVIIPGIEVKTHNGKQVDLNPVFQISDTAPNAIVSLPVFFFCHSPLLHPPPLSHPSGREILVDIQRFLI